MHVRREKVGSKTRPTNARSREACQMNLVVGEQELKRRAHGALLSDAHQTADTEEL